MLNTEHFMLLAGNPQKWDDETRSRCRVGNRSGTFNSEDLCVVQVDQSARGRRSAIMVLSIYGWTVRYASGLQGFSILHSSGDKNPAAALAWGIQWANEDPENREFYVSKGEIKLAEEKGVDCSAIQVAAEAYAENT